MDRKPPLIAPLIAPLVVSRAGAALMLVGALFGASHACAQPDAEDRTFERAGKIASQPARDVGIARDKIPPVLQRAIAAPYAEPNAAGCGGVTEELTALNAVLGADFDEHRKGDDRATQLAEAGGSSVVNSLIPFRGLVREISGAASNARRLEAAVNAGLARRGYLRGLAAVRGCTVPPTPPTPAKKGP